jgi:hypothetical protein
VLVELKALLIGFAVGALVIAGVALATGRGDHASHAAPAASAHDWPAKVASIGDVKGRGP